MVWVAVDRDNELDHFFYEIGNELRNHQKITFLSQDMTTQTYQSIFFSNFNQAVRKDLAGPRDPGWNIIPKESN